MTELSKLVTYINNLLQIELFKDYCPNGLQIEGKEKIARIVTGVTANQALIDAAIDAKADAILVHHGFFWKNESPCILGIKRNRIKALLAKDISLLAYHLPLDAHPLYGNNIQLGKKLGFNFTSTFEVEPGLPLGFLGKLSSPLPAVELSEQLSQKLSRPAVHIPSSRKIIETVAWCTGGAQDYFEKAILQNIDAYITGEVSERTFHIAKENEVHFYAAGHHATERYGVQALGEHLQEKFKIHHQFIDIDNPI